uniref:CRAL-TRIO domain-containing protein n=1 Tax=Glossina brevipalpis TaxID=37001 RepID=A0A1A9X1J2_9MUSC
MLDVSFDIVEQYVRLPKVEREEVQRIVEWVRAQHYMPNLSEGEILLFYVACKCSSEMTKQTIDTNLTYHTHVDEFFNNIDPELGEMKRAMQVEAMFVLPKLTPEGHRVFFAKLIDLNSSNFNFADAIKLYILLLEVFVREDDVRQGYRFVFDVSGITLGHVARLGIMTMKKLLCYLQEALPTRLFSLHFINIVPYMDKILALMYPFMKKDLLDILYIHSKLDEFYKFVPQNILPKELGGEELESVQLREIFYDKIRSRRKEILEYEKLYRINEKLRPGKPKNASDLFGIEGTFKKLDID